MMRFKRSLNAGSGNRKTWRYYIPYSLIEERNGDTLFALYELDNDSILVTFVDVKSLSELTKEGKKSFLLKAKAWKLKDNLNYKRPLFQTTLLETVADAFNLDLSRKYDIYFIFKDAVKGIARYRIHIEMRV